MLGSARTGTRVRLHNGLRLGYQLEFGTHNVTLTAFRTLAVWTFLRKIKPRFLQTHTKVETNVDQSRSCFLIYKTQKQSDWNVWGHFLLFRESLQPGRAQDRRDFSHKRG